MARTEKGITMNDYKYEGILSEGFGVIAKQAMKDTRLTIEAKAVYAYICAYAGNDGCAFPSVDRMKTELGISRERLYKHREILIKYGYIRIEKARKKGKQANNVYVICNSVQSAQNLTAENQTPEKPTSEKPLQVPENLTSENLASTKNSLTKNNARQKTNKSEFDSIIEAYTSNDELRTVLKEFLKHRKALKKPMTEYALQCLLRKLDRELTTEDSKIRELNTSIERGWQTVCYEKSKPKNDDDPGVTFEL